MPIFKKSVFFVFQENYENFKGEMRELEIHASRDVQKSVRGDGKRNEHNCITGGAISTTMFI